MSESNTCYLCGHVGKGFRPAVQSGELMGAVIGIHPKSFGSWGLCPNCRIALGKGTRSWMEKYIPRGFIPYAWTNQPKKLKGGWKKRRGGSGRPKGGISDIEEVSLKAGDKLIKEFEGLSSLNQHSKARFFERLAEDHGVLHLLKPSQDKPDNSAAVGISGVKSYASKLSLSQRKVERLASDINRDSGTKLFPSRSTIRASLSQYKTNFCLRDEYVVAKAILSFVCQFFGLSTSTTSRGLADLLVVGLDYGGGTTKVVVRPHAIEGGHGCLVLLHARKDSRPITELIVHELAPLNSRFLLRYSGDNRQLQFLAGTSANACWLCGAVEGKREGRNTFTLSRGSDRWESATVWEAEYRAKCQRLRKPPAHINGQKWLPLISKDSLLLPWLHILMGVVRNVFDGMIRSGASRDDLEDLLKTKLHIAPTKPISGSTLEKTNILAFAGKDCKTLVESLSTVKLDLVKLPKGPEAYSALLAVEGVRRALMNPNSTLAVDEVLGTLRSAYEKGGFNPSLVIHLLIVHGAELYAPYSSQGLRLLTEELAERIHSQVNVVIRRSQVKDDLLKQISLWNWQHSADENCQEGGEEAETPPAKRQRKPSRMSPQVSGWLTESDLSGILSAVNSKSTHSEYQDTGESEED